MLLFFNTDDSDIQTKVRNLNPTPGFCVVADIVGSVELKDSPFPVWANLTSNHVKMFGWFLRHFTFRKVIGDALMCFVSEEDFKKSPESLLHIFTSMAEYARDRNEDYLRSVRIGITHCNDAYELTFTPNAPDFHGKDIDLAFRLAQLAGPREVVMNERFVERVREENSRTGKTQFLVDEIQGPWSQKIKGFAQNVPIYKLPDS